MGFKDGDFVLIEYTVRVKETGNVVDTTDENLAKKENIYESGRVYGPVLVVIGRKWINEAVEEVIREMEVGEEREVEVPPEKAFGPRDPSKIKTFSMREFRRRNINVRVGDVVDFGGAKGVVKSISGGRVVVDFNHPLAGKTLIYKVKVVGKLEDLVDKVKALSERYLQIPGNELGIEYEPESKRLIISIPTKYMTRKDLQYGKISLATSVYDFFKDQVNEIVFQESFKFKKEEEKKAEEKAAEESEGGNVAENVEEAKSSIQETGEASENA